MVKYPTKKEILDHPVIIKPETIAIIKAWKSEFFHNWSDWDNQTKLTRLNSLIYCIQVMENTGIPFAKVKEGKEYKYNLKTNTIYHNKNIPSIISSLHELAHHLFGDSEFNACRWSVHAFKQCFPHSFGKLEWQNHKLVKK